MQNEADRDVEPEDPLPGDALDDRAADQRAERDGQAADPAPCSEREPALLRRCRVAEDRQRKGHDDRSPETLEGAGEHERLDRRRERGRGRGSREDDETR